MLTASCALAGGASKVLISDVSAIKLAIAAQIPGIIPVDLTKEDLVERVREETGGWGADGAFECSGSPKSYETFWKLIAPGGAAVIVGIPVNPVAIDITELQATEVRIENIFRYANVYQKAIDLVANGKLNLKPFITDTYAMEDAQAAFDRMAEGRPGDIKLQITVKKTTDVTHVTERRKGFVSWVLLHKSTIIGMGRRLWFRPLLVDSCRKVEVRTILAYWRSLCRTRRLRCVGRSMATQARWRNGIIILILKFI